MARTAQPIFCNACGRSYETTFVIGFPNGEHVCSAACFDEIRWREALSVVGKPYEPRAGRAPEGGAG